MSIWAVKPIPASTIGVKALFEPDGRHMSHPQRLTIKTAVLAVVAGMILAVTGCQSTQQSTSSSAPPPGVDRYVDGALALRQGDKQTAIAELTTAVQVNPKLCMAHEVLAELYRKQGQLELAQQNYAAASALDPYNVSNWYNLGLVDQWLNKLEDAVVAYLRALEIDPKDL